VAAVAIVVVVTAALVVFAIAAVAIGREARRLDARAPRTVYQLDEAVAYVGDRLDTSEQARLTFDEVRELVRAHMALLHAKGLLPPGVIDRVQDLDEVVVVDETDSVAYAIGWADDHGLAVTDADVAAVIDAHLDYLRAIGAVGPPATEE
jgi:hypothetical protein